MELIKKAAYIKGLVDGLELDPNDKQTKIINALVELVNDMASEISDLNQCYDDVCDQIDALDEDLSGVEDAIYDVLDEDYEDDDLSSCDCSACNPSDDDMIYEVVCPVCEETINLGEETLLKGGITCPKCGEILEFDYDSDELDENTDDKTLTEE